MGSSTQSFYDDMAASYHLIFADWEASIRRQGELLDRLIRAELNRGPEDGITVLDCSCGIGTQAIGLAQRGYTVHATDLSPAAVERAGREAARLGATLTTGVADFRTLDRQVEGQFDVVLTFDNALPHLLTDDDLRAAAKGLAAKTKPGGVLLASIRDYDALIIERPTFDGLRQINSPDSRRPRETGQRSDQSVHGLTGRRIVFQMWDWDADGAAYTVNQFILKEDGQNWTTEHYQARYRALRRAELEGFLAEAGFGDLHWNFDSFYQPVLIARRA